MESKAAVNMLSALGHDGRLAIFRLLVKAGPVGIAAGDIARTLEVLPNSLSANLNVLSHAGLIAARREGRSIIYAARFETMNSLIAYLTENCCGGDAGACAPACTPKSVRTKRARVQA